MSDKPAFPTPEYTDATGDLFLQENGLTRRELFAAMAMQGLITGLYASSDSIITMGAIGAEHGDETVEQTIAREAVNSADALIAELDK